MIKSVKSPRLARLARLERAGDSGNAGSIKDWGWECMSRQVVGYEYADDFEEFLTKNGGALGITSELAVRVANELDMHVTTDLKHLSREEVFEIGCLGLEHQRTFWEMVHRLHVDAAFMRMANARMADLVTTFLSPESRGAHMPATAEMRALLGRLEALQ